MRHIVACINWAFSFAFVDEAGRYLGAINERPQPDDTVLFEVRPVSGGKHEMATLKEAEEFLRARDREARA